MKIGWASCLTFVVVVVILLYGIKMELRFYRLVGGKERGLRRPGTDHVAGKSVLK